MSKVPKSYIKSVAIQIDSNYNLENSPFVPENDDSETDQPKKPGNFLKRSLKLFSAPFVKLSSIIKKRRKASLEETPKADKQTDNGEMPSSYIGRSQHIAKFVKFLQGENSKGVFLVTGYRGMGKTSFVNHVIEKYKGEISKRKKEIDERRNVIENRISKIEVLKKEAKKHNKPTTEFEKEFNQYQHELRKYQKETQDPKLVKPIHLTLAQNNPKELDILRLMVISVYDEFKSFLKKEEKDVIKEKKAAIYRLQHELIFIILVSLPLIFRMWKAKAFFSLYEFWLRGCWFSFYSLSERPWVYLNIVYTLAVIFLFFRFCFRYYDLKTKVYELEHSDKAINRITWLVERCNAALGEEVVNAESGLPTINFKLFSEEKKTKQYAVVNNKEIEYELQKFLQKAREEYGLKFIFVFDELDKVDPALNNSMYPEYLSSYANHRKEKGHENSLKDRSQAIINIIAGLKNFFTTADARFIFIAGREMFDASLADIADRQSAVSSIFTFVFYIESLLKEKDDNDNPSLSNAIEEYLRFLLFGEKRQEKSEEKFSVKLQTFKVYENEADRAVSQVEWGNLYFIFQNFITYLTYRSNGSPKKLIKEIHEFIVLEEKIEQLKRDEDGKDIIYENTKLTEKYANENRGLDPSDVKKRRLYLYFNYYNQYRIGFISYLYRPFLIKYGRSFKLFSDNIVVSTSFLFDHLLKFHPFAFSISNLELLPEILSSNKTPTLRLHIKQIIEYLGANHIREIEIGLFDYKFYSRTLNEITFLSRVFDQEAAALNYTLDESYHIKLLVINKIKELRSDYSLTPKTSDPGRQVFSIAHLNGTLGDLHFFDQEYDDAIVAYSDAIRTISQEPATSLSLQDFVVLVRIRLKLGLCFEKMNAYDDALAQFVDCSLNAARLVVYRLNEGVNLTINRNDDPENLKKRDKMIDRSPGYYDKAIYRSAALSDTLQIILQGFLSQVFIQEKKSVAGISEYKLFKTLSTFMRITEGFKLAESRNCIIKANAFLHAGNLVYFKNTDRGINFEDKQIIEAYKQNLSRDLKVNLKALSDKYDPIFFDQYGYRRPVLALYLYIMGLTETLNFGKRERLGENPIPKPVNLTEGLDPFIAEIIGSETQNNTQNIAYQLLIKIKEEETKPGKISRGIYYNYIGSFLSNIGDCMLSNYDNYRTVKRPAKEFIKEKSIEDLFLKEKLLDSNIIVNDDILFDYFLKESVNDKYFSLADVLRCYYLSGRYYLKQGRSFSCAFQYRKILYLLRLVLNYEQDKELALSFMKMLNNKILRPILEINSQNAYNTDYHMFNKAKIDPINVAVNYALNNLSNHPETREVVFVYNYIKIKLGVVPDNISSLISPENSFATQQSRLMELDFYSKYLEKKKPFDTEASGIGLSEKEQEKLILNGTAYLYSMLSILQILDIYGSDYWLGHSYFAYTHFRVAEYLSKLEEENPSKEKIGTQLKTLLGEGSFSSQDRFYHYSKAKKLYENAIQLHTAGDAYKTMIDDMVYLEDDFNDTAYHFGAALDRYMMINHVFSTRIAVCAKALKDSPNFNEENFRD